MKTDKMLEADREQVFSVIGAKNVTSTRVQELVNAERAATGVSGIRLGQVVLILKDLVGQGRLLATYGGSSVRYRVKPEPQYRWERVLDQCFVYRKHPDVAGQEIQIASCTEDEAQQIVDALNGEDDG